MAYLRASVGFSRASILHTRALALVGYGVGVSFFVVPLHHRFAGAHVEELLGPAEEPVDGRGLANGQLRSSSFSSPARSRFNVTSLTRLRFPERYRLTFERSMPVASTS